MIPLIIIRAYRLIPVFVRKLWGFGGSGTSHLALMAALNGEGWGAFRFARLQFTPYPSWSDPGPQGSGGISWKGEGGGPHP